MNRFLNRLPTITIREGHRVKVYLTSDLQLPEYSAGLVERVGAERGGSTMMRRIIAGTAFDRLGCRARHMRNSPSSIRQTWRRRS